MAAVAESWTPAWQAAPPPAIQIRGVEGRFRQKLNGSYQLTPHNGPKPALTYVNPTNNSCVVYGHHDKAGKVDFTGWVAGWVRDNSPDDFFVCAKGLVQQPEKASVDGSLAWEVVNQDGEFETSPRMQIIPLDENNFSPESKPVLNLSDALKTMKIDNKTDDDDKKKSKKSNKNDDDDKKKNEFQLSPKAEPFTPSLVAFPGPASPQNFQTYPPPPPPKSPKENATPRTKIQSAKLRESVSKQRDSKRQSGKSLGSFQYSQSISSFQYSPRAPSAPPSPHLYFSQENFAFGPDNGHGKYEIKNGKRDFTFSPRAKSFSPRVSMPFSVQSLSPRLSMPLVNNVPLGGRRHTFCQMPNPNHLFVPPPPASPSPRLKNELEMAGRASLDLPGLSPAHASFGGDSPAHAFPTPAGIKHHDSFARTSLGALPTPGALNGSYTGRASLMVSPRASLMMSPRASQSRKMPSQMPAEKYVPNAPEIRQYKSPMIPPGFDAPHFGGPVHHQANQPKTLQSSDLLKAAGVDLHNGAFTTPYAATTAAVGFHMPDATAAPSMGARASIDLGNIAHMSKKSTMTFPPKDGELRAEAPSYIPSQAGAESAETAMGLATSLIFETQELKKGGVNVTTKKASWTIQEDTRDGEPVDSPPFRLRCANGTASPPMQLRFHPTSINGDGHEGYVTVSLICPQGVRMKFKLSCDKQNSGSKVLMGTKYSMDFQDPKLPQLSNASPRAGLAVGRANHRLIIVSLELVDWI